jgi:hypothetical protein
LQLHPAAASRFLKFSSNQRPVYSPASARNVPISSQYARGTNERIFSSRSTRIGEGWRLHAADRRQLEAPGLRIERRHRARAVDADEPIRLGTADRGVGEGKHLLVAAQPLEAVADGRGRHRLQPEPLDRLVGLRVLDDVAEDQLAFATRVACVDQAVDVLALDEAQQCLQPRFVLLDRLQREFRRNGRQVRERSICRA